MFSVIFVIAKNTFLEAVRSKILHSVLLFGVFIVGVSALFGSVSIGEAFRVIKSFGYTIVSISSVVCVVISGVSLFQKEIAQKTIYNILSKPVQRTNFLIGKFFGLWFTGAVLATLMMFMLLTFLIPFEGKFDPLGFEALFFMILEIGIISAVTILFSSVSVTPVLPGLFSFAVYIAGKSIFYLKSFNAPTLEQTSELAVISQNPLLKKLVDIFDLILPDLHLLTPYDQLVYSISVGGERILYSLVYSLSYMALMILLGTLFFSRRDF